MKKLLTLKRMSVMVISLLLLTICLCGCSSSGGSSSSGSAPKVAGKTETWGNLTVLVPDGMKLVSGDLTDSQNPDALTIQDNKEVYKYFIIAIRDEDSINMGMEMTKEMNSECTFKDVEIKLDNGTFKGYSYNSQDVECIQLKGKIGEKFVQVGTAGFNSDDDVLKAVLASIAVN